MPWLGAGLATLGIALTGMWINLGATGRPHCAYRFFRTFNPQPQAMAVAWAQVVDSQHRLRLRAKRLCGLAGYARRCPRKSHEGDRLRPINLNYQYGNVMLEDIEAVRGGLPGTA